MLSLESTYAPSTYLHYLYKPSNDAKGIEMGIYPSLSFSLCGLRIWNGSEGLIDFVFCLFLCYSPCGFHFKLQVRSGVNVILNTSFSLVNTDLET